jgi:predicted ATPase/class 3 adenylate cyclase
MKIPEGCPDDLCDILMWKWYKQQVDRGVWERSRAYPEGSGLARGRQIPGQQGGKAMTFDDILAQVLDLLQRQGRVSYRALKRRFNLDDEYLEDLKVELIDAQQVAIDEQGRVLVWRERTETAPAPLRDQGHDHPQLQSSEPLAAPRGVPEAERRQLTVLFCDLVDSTVLAARLDPEEWREIVRAYQATSAEVIQRFEGHIAQYLGDGLLVYYSYPQAHEDDAPRAVRSGIGIVEAMGKLNTRLAQERGLRLSIRVGIHTGLVVVGEIGGGDRQEQLAMGETPNVAARLQGLAAPDTVVISASTFRLVQGLFECRQLGPQTLKGVSTPMPVYQVIGESVAQSLLEAAGPAGLTPLVGRQQEVGLLLERWAQVKEGLGQVVWLSGEAGIGKSRLVQVLKDHVANEPHLRWECRCSPYYQNSAFYPLIDLFQRVLRLTSDDALDDKLRKLEEALALTPSPPMGERVGVRGSDWQPVPSLTPALSQREREERLEMVPLFAALLSLPLPERYPALSMPPQRQKQKTMEAVLRVLQALAARQPVLFIVEDLHWGDPSTLELLNLLIDQGPTARILTLLVFRPEFRPSRGFRAYVTPMALARLPHHQTEALVEQVIGGKELPAEVRQQIVAKTDGVPLFVEELTKMVLESGLLRERAGVYELTGPLPSLAIPATLHDSLMARLDRLATVKEVAQLGATLGRTFSFDLLQAVAPWDDATLQHALARLVEAELLYQRGLPPTATYLFKHALIQEAAYQSVLKSRRQQAHQRIAQVLEERFPDTAQTQPELLAHHYTEAGLAAHAVPYWQRAGQLAVQRSANLEAVAHLTKGLEVLATLPDTPERAQQELVVQTTLGPALMVTKGYSAPEMLQAYARARELCQRVGDTPQLFQVLRGLWYLYLHRVELRMARELGEQLLTLAQRVGDPALLLEAHYTLGNTLNYLGEFAAAHAHFAQGIALYNPQRHHAHAFRYGQDPGVICRAYAGVTLWWLGYPDQALQRSHEALTLARELAHPFSLGFALFFAAWLHQLRREWHLTQERAEAGIALAAEQGFVLWGALGTFMRGWALTERDPEPGAERGPAEKGIAQMQQGLAALRAIPAEVFRPYGLTLLAEAFARVGQIEEGLTLLAEALALTNDKEERRCEAELYRLQGELLLARAAEHDMEAETCFRQALDVARRQQAKSWELRAAMSLSRLWQRQGKHDEARRLLTEIYGWFTEGLDTLDLQEAQALLRAMEGGKAQHLS